MVKINKFTFVANSENMKQLIECVPNFSEGRNKEILDKIADAIRSVEGVKLLDIDAGYATNRTVFTFVGEPEPIIEAAFRSIRTAHELIDMTKHKGEHPRMGATDVCPLIPIRNISMDEVVTWAHKLGKRVGEELNLSGYFYEMAATFPARKNLADVRAGEYEGLGEKITSPEWKPDFGPAVFNPKYGATAIAARNFLVAYNINLNTTSTRRANAIAFDVREAGRFKTDAKGKNILDENGEPIRIPGTLKAVKAIGWYIDEYGIAQISTNLTDITVTSIHQAFDEISEKARLRGIRVTGSELVGLVPLQCLLDAGKYFLEKQQRSTGVPDAELIKIAIKSLGLDDLKPFDPKKKIIEYMLDDDQGQKLVSLSIEEFCHQTSAETPTPGGGSVSAVVGAFGVSLATMVANLSSHKRGWDDQWMYFSKWAEKGQQITSRLLYLVDEDTASFNLILEAFRLPKQTAEEQAFRKNAIQEATKYATEIPFRVMQTVYEALPIAEAMIHKGLPSSVSDGAVGVICMQAAMRGAYLNVKINISSIQDKTFVAEMLGQADQLMQKMDTEAKALIELAESHI